MTYQEFVAIIFSPVRYFINWLEMIANSLMNNYIFVTFLNLTMAISLIFLFINSVIFIFNKIINRNLDYIERKQNYELYKKVQHDYLNSHRLDEYDYLYDNYILKQQVLNGVYRNHPDLLLNNKVENFRLNAQALKKIEKDSLSDNDSSNDDDIDYLVPNKGNNPPSNNSSIQLAKISELHKYEGLSSSDLKVTDIQLRNEINSNIDRIMEENKDLLAKKGLGYNPKNNTFFDLKSGEVVDLSNDNKANSTLKQEKNIINLGRFAYYDKVTKGMKTIMLPVIGDDLQNYQFDNKNLSDIDRDFVTSHTLVRIK